jgi:hypothetical protein
VEYRQAILGLGLHGQQPAEVRFNSRTELAKVTQIAVAAREELGELVAG